MKCFEYAELISAYIDDELSKGEVKKLLVHLDVCRECKKDLSKLALQKEKVVSLRAFYAAPDPGADFCQKVMAAIGDESSPPEPKEVRVFLADLVHQLFFYVKRPAFAISLSSLVVIGALAGFLWGVFSFNTDQTEQLLSVYELPASHIPKKSVEVSNVEEDEDSIVFHHIAHSSVETFATQPCLLGYAAYTPVSDNY